MHSELRIKIAANKYGKQSHALHRHLIRMFGKIILLHLKHVNIRYLAIFIPDCSHA
jgi:hypothetical protein